MKQFVQDFSWQDGGGAFSVGPMDVIAVRKYLAEQEKHHRIHDFREEFTALLKKYGIPYEEQHLL